jgi:quercetin dioxygenase-like cupin family protein
VNRLLKRRGLVTFFPPEVPLQGAFNYKSRHPTEDNWMKHINMAIAAALGLSLVSAISAQKPPLPYHGQGHIMVRPTQLEWKPVPSMAPGATMALIEGDLSSERPFTFRLRLPDGYRIAPHTHPAYERVTVLSGTFHFAHGERFDRARTQALPPGSFAVMPPGAPMYGYAEGETVIQLHGQGPWAIEYLNPADDPRKSAQK